MHRAVRTFKATMVEARFLPLIVSLGVLAMRAAMYLAHGAPTTSYADTGFLWQYVSPFFSNPDVSFVASTASVFCIAWLLSRLNNVFSLIRTRTHLPYVTPLFLFSLHPYFLAMTPDYISVILILFAFFPLLHSYQQPVAQVYSFQSSVLIGLASLFQLFSLLLLPLWWRGESSMRGIRAKSLLSSLLGIILIYLSVFSVYFLFDDIPGFVSRFLHVADASLPALPDFSMLQWGFLTAVFLLFVLIMFFSIRTYTRDKVLTLSTMQFMVFLLVFLIAFQIVYWNKTLFFLVLGIALLSCLIAYFYTITTHKTHIYAAYGVISLLIAFYFVNYFSLLSFM